MYELNGICYAGEKTPDLSVTCIRILDDGILLVQFSTGETRLFDVTSLLNKGSAFLPLAVEENRKTAKVTYGFVSWMDGQIDISPEAMYEDSYSYESPADTNELQVL